MGHFCKEVGQMPLHGKYFLCTTLAACLVACEFLMNDPTHPYVLGLAMEYLSTNCPWENWLPENREPFNIQLFGNVKLCGPFVAILQL
uniref:Uncharacterized protein n=1 Tax=Romanomermis culicivorax TaxID=13658 RepID=A0A915JVW3_ROMCU